MDKTISVVEAADGVSFRCDLTSVVVSGPCESEAFLKNELIMIIKTCPQTAAYLHAETEMAEVETRL